MENFAALQSLDYYLTTLSYLDEKYVNGSDEDLKYYILEELDADAHTFLHYNTVDILLNADLIPESVEEKTQQLRDLVRQLIDTKKSLDQIRNDPEWKKARQMAAEILSDIHSFQDTQKDNQGI